jgi:amino acid transporter
MSSLWRTKSVEQSIQDTDEPGHKLKRTLSAWDLTIFGVAVVIGAGIFTLTTRVAATTAGPAVSIAFVISAIACGLAAMCYAEFASTVPVAGSGLHVLLRDSGRTGGLDHRLGSGAGTGPRRLGVVQWLVAVPGKPVHPVRWLAGDDHQPRPDRFRLGRPA